LGHRLGGPVVGIGLSLQRLYPSPSLASTRAV